MTGATSWRLTDQPALQGVRAVAVLAVCGYHTGQLAGGWLGVEAFFVLSGFLITCLILGEEWASGPEGRGTPSGRSGLARFYLRRIGRLFPALLAMVIAVMAYVSLRDPVVTSVDVDHHERVAIGTLLLHANWLGIDRPDQGFFGHVWSLSVEEQFYLTWPIILLACARLGGARAVAVVATAGFVASATLRTLLADGDGLWHVRIYLGTDTRAAGLLIGCAAGAWMMHTHGQLGRRLPWGWLMALLVPPIAWAMVVLRQWELPSWDFMVTLFDVAVALLVVGLVDRVTWLSRALSLRPVVYLGAISYSLYLWQLPVSRVAFLELNSMGAARTVAVVVLPVVFAVASYHLLEQPVRRWVRRRAAAVSLEEESPARA